MTSPGETSVGNGPGTGSGEFALIETYFRPLAADAPAALGLRDDAAVFQPSPGNDLVMTQDTLVASVHFLPDDPPGRVARKALRVNLSDLAAMGAEPLGYLLSLSLADDSDEAWIAAAAAGLAEDQAEFGIHLWGGDTVSTPGPLTLTVTAIGQTPAGAALHRRGAQPGDLVLVSGMIGDAGLGLRALKGGHGRDDAPGRDYLVERYQLPSPRLPLGLALRGLATAVIDVSDGLAADLGHICLASAVGAQIGLGQIPVSPAAAQSDMAMADLISAGEDYELLFTLPPEATDAFKGRLGPDDPPVQLIGEVVAGEGVTVLDADGAPVDLPNPGWQHR
jgi:thiamine-monophosphate kinase